MSAAVGYFFLAGGILILNIGLLEALTQVIGLPVYPAKLLTEVILFIISFLMQDRVIFKKKEKQSEARIWTKRAAVNLEAGSEKMLEITGRKMA